jgi:Rieske 2Fe-2S family protein
MTDARPTLVPTLTARDYTDPAVFERERERLFHGGWFMCARADTLAPGNRRVVDIAGESVLLARDLDGTIHAHANVCRHRGARLCDGDVASSQGSLMCPYHAWTYALDGHLIATPHLDADELSAEQKAELSLWRHHVAVWEGFVFVSLAATPVPFDDWLQLHGQELLPMQRFSPGSLRVAVRTSTDVAANWKVIVENYQECLHCTRVHPELVDIIPTYRSGWVYDRSRDDGGVTLRDHGNSFAFGGTTDLPLLPGFDAGEDASSYYGCTGFPNLFVDVTGTSMIVSTLFPKSPSLTTMTMEYLFAPSTIDADGFDPTPIVEFSELVGAQDNLVCERVQLGVTSRSFAGGVLTAKDDLVVGFVEHYRRSMA